MPAAGKTNASRVQINDRIIVRVAANGTVWESTTKTGEGVQVARVTGKTFVTGGQYVSHGRRQGYYRITTSAGPINAAPVQTMWLAPEDNAGIKRAHVEALAEDEARRIDAKHQDLVETDHAEALEMDARRSVTPATEEMDEPSATAQSAAADESRWSMGSILDAHDEALREDAERASLAQARAWVARHDLPWAGREYVQQAVDADHAQALAEDAKRCPNCAPGYDCESGVYAPAQDLTLHSQDGKVGPDSDTYGGEADMTSTDTQTATSENQTGSTVVRLLERVWARIREDHPELPEVVIITGSGEGSKWGHFRADSWKVKEEGAAVRRHELFLASEALAKGPGQVVQTMLHEAAHSLSRVRGVQDTSRQGRWHNAQFRSAAAEMGLVHKADKADRSHGFAFVTLTEATKARYADLITELEREIRLTGHLPVWLGGDAEEDERGGERMTKPKTGEEEEGERKNGSMKAVCGCEEPVIIRLSDKVLNMRVVRCDDCQELFHRP